MGRLILKRNLSCWQLSFLFPRIYFVVTGLEGFVDLYSITSLSPPVHQPR